MIEMQTSLEAIERIEHVVPRISDRREPEKRRPPFPEIEGEPAREPPQEAPEKDPPREDSDPEEHRVDLVVLGRFLPTGQYLPPAEAIPILH